MTFSAYMYLCAAATWYNQAVSKMITFVTHPSIRDARRIYNFYLHADSLFTFKLEDTDTKRQGIFNVC